MKDVDRYTDSEICMLYRQARNKNDQVKILEQLTGKSTCEIKNILMSGGYIEMNDERKENILGKYKEGLSDIAIARATGYPQSQVSTFLRGQGLPANGKSFGGKVKKTEDVIEEAKQDIQEPVNSEIKVEEKQSEEKNEEEIKPMQNVEKPEEKKVAPRSSIANDADYSKVDLNKPIPYRGQEAEPKEKAIDWKAVHDNLEQRIESGQVKNDKLDLAFITLEIIDKIWRTI